MKALYWLLTLAASTSVAIAQPSGKTVKLVGIVGLDVNCAIFEVAKTYETRKHETRQQTNQITLGINQTDSGVQVQSINVSKGTVVANVDGEARTLSFDAPKGAEPTGQPSTIRLSNVKLQRIILIYGELKGRTVLQHPGLKDSGFTLTANPQGRPEAAKTLEDLFASHGIAAIPDGKKFVMLVPFAFTNRVSPHSDKIADTGPNVPALSVNFQNVPLPKVLEVYGEYLGHPVNNLQTGPYAPVYLVQTNPLSRGQLCYTMETLFTWNGVRVVTNSDSSSSWEHISQ